MDSLQRTQGQKTSSGSVYNAPLPQPSAGRFAYRKVIKAKAEPRLFGIHLKAYSEEAKFKFNQAFLTTKTQEAAPRVCPPFLSFQPPGKIDWKYPDVMHYLQDIYNQFVNAFCNEMEAKHVISRLSEFLLAIDKGLSEHEEEKRMELFLKYPKKVKNHLLIQVCDNFAQVVKGTYCERSILFFCGLTALLIELENYVDYPDDPYCLPHHFIADFLLSVLSGESNPLFLNNKTAEKYLKFFTKKRQLFHFFPCSFKHLDLSPLFLMMNDYYWGKIHTSDTETSAPHKANELWSFFCDSAAPQYIFETIFGDFFNHETAYYDELIYPLPGSLSNTLPMEMATFNPDFVRFGEEFEFFLTSTSGIEYSADHLVKKWFEHISDKMFSMGIPDTEFSLTMTEDILGNELYFTFGDWDFKCYDDSGALEINCSPYKKDQRFTCNGTSYTAYELFDLFINDPANQLLLAGRSGHKHVDIRNSISNNPELIFRFLLSVENESFLAKALGRVGRCQGFFPYLSMCKGASQWQLLLENAIQLINRELATGGSGKPMGFYTCAQVFANLWSLKHSYCPAKIRLFPEHASHLSEKQEPKKVCKPDGTLELRFWHGARSGQEAQKINEIILAWMKTLAQQQESKVPLFYEPADFDSLDSNEKIRKRFDSFCKKIGLPPERYHDLLRLS